MTQPLGLPKSAWINSAQYSMTGGFPPIGKLGDRVFRPDSDSRWFAHNGTTWVAEPTVKSGTSTAVFTTPVIGDRLYRTDQGLWYSYGSGAFVVDGGGGSSTPISGTSFPTSPVSGQQFFRTDQNINYQYKTVSSITNWYPEAGTLICTGYSSGGSGQTLSVSGTIYPVTYSWTMTKNLNSWFDTSTGRFTPTLPGYYQVGGSVGFSGGTSTVATYRIAYIGINGTGSLVSGSKGTLIPPNGIQTPVPAPASPQYFTGTTYVILCAQANTASQVISNVEPSTFTAIYLGNV